MASTSGRSSSASGRSQSAKSVPDKQISQIEKSVTHLLVATKQLLETLTQWSRKQASETDVSDVYVRLGYEFNLACRAFNAIGVETSDLGPVPDVLRTILEDTLSQDASSQSLDRYLPQIRDIIINLLHGLKKKQARLRSRQQREDARLGLPGRQASAGSLSSGQSTIGQLYDEAAASTMPQNTVTSPKRSARRYNSNGSLEEPSTAQRPSPGSAGDGRGPSYSERDASRREAQQVLTQPSLEDTDSTPRAPVSASGTPPAFPAPPPPPKQDDALGALQRSGELERRASRRFSAYQIQKHLGTSTNGVPVLPSQNSPIPNRGRDVRESLNAVRLRGSYTHTRQRSSNRLQETAKGGQAQDAAANIPQAVEEEQSKQASETESGVQKEESAQPSPLKDQPPPPPIEKDLPEEPRASATTPTFPQPPKGPSLDDAFDPEKTTASVSQTAPETPRNDRFMSAAIATPPSIPQFPIDQPSPGKELTLFLQYKSKIKKYVLPEGIADLTIGRLQLAFIEKFAWNTHNNGADLPEIYIQDPISGIRHELEDLNDVKDRSVLVLNVDTLDEVKKHFDESFGGVRQLVEGVKDALVGQGTAIQRVSDRQLEAAKEMARLAAAPPPAPTTASGTTGPVKTPIAGSGSQIAELQSLRRDLAVLRQTYSNFSSDIASSMSAVRAKAGKVTAAAENVAVPTFEGDAGRARVNTGKKELADESERLVARVDDLQDLVEDLRKDVVTRGVRPLPRQLEGVNRDISTAMKEIKKMQDFLGREKPIWTKIWEKELQLVCEERDQLTMQEDLAADLQDDLEKAAQTFALVEQATKEQAMEKAANGGVSLRATSRTLGIDPTVDPMKAKDDVLGEVRALQPNHESRLEAIERAEKARKKELETRRIGLFQKELGNFVQEGKLKKSGGVEEAERLRNAKDDRIRKEVWDRQQVRNAEMAKAEAEAALAASDQKTDGDGDGDAAGVDASPDSKDSDDNGPNSPKDESSLSQEPAKRDTNNPDNPDESASTEPSSEA
ncbi:hypothetical protein N7462_004118 [Penicillium macrosclerotiorum]|uniref:uncharacterized protein n=1 Tax=Penicillium macrosclerotiorum TaxID=303699 RepID=UPI00254675BE|nr:uncharacterized protein N7462_004118 [Penicillium macrosclerotiorum]KAJ5689726.1 hypothetical protein N7462_004118 [Penicillium macrosclerotiorum]